MQDIITWIFYFTKIRDYSLQSNSEHVNTTGQIFDGLLVPIYFYEADANEYLTLETGADVLCISNFFCPSTVEK